VPDRVAVGRQFLRWSGVIDRDRNVALALAHIFNIR